MSSFVIGISWNKLWPNLFDSLVNGSFSQVMVYSTKFTPSLFLQCISSCGQKNARWAFVCCLWKILLPLDAKKTTISLLWYFKSFNFWSLLILWIFGNFLFQIFLEISQELLVFWGKTINTYFIANLSSFQDNLKLCKSILYFQSCA